MTDFAFQISGDASKADKAIDSVLARLEAIKRQAAQSAVTPGLDKMAAGFARLGEAIRKEQQALQRTSQLHQQLTAAAQPAAQAFGKMAEAIQREQQMLERIHGPMRQHAQDLQTLNALMQKGAITAQQYQMATTRTPSVGSYSVAKVGLPGIGGLGGLAATAGAVVGGGAAFGALDDFQNMQNRLRFLAGGDVQKVNSLFTQLQGVAGRTRQSLGATTETFVKVSMATKQMGMSTGETMQFMERLNKAVALSGASSSAASAGLLQLSQGLSAGALRGEEFNSVVEQIPAVAQVIADSLGVSVGQLRIMAQDGKITGDVVVNAFTKMGASIDKDFGNTLPTVGQHWQAFKDKMTLAIGEMDRALGIANKLGAALAYVGDTLSISSLKSGKGGVFDIVNVLTLGQAGRNLDERITREANESVKELAKVYDDLVSTTDEWGYAVTRVVEKITVADFATNSMLVKFNRNAEEMRQAGKDIDAFQTLTGSFNRGQLTVMDKIAPSKEAIARAKALREEYEKLLQAANDAARLWMDRDRARTDLGDQLANLGTVGAAGLPLYDDDDPGAARAKSMDYFIDLEGATSKWDTIKQEQLEVAIEAEKAAQQTREAWARGFGEIGRSFADAAAEGKQSFGEMTQALMRDIAMLVVKMAALRLIQGGGSGALAGQAMSGLFGFAHGGIIAEGSGGTDSQLVAFRKSPNERVTIETPEQQRTGSLRGGNGGALAVHVSLPYDRRDIVEGLDSRDGERVYAKLSGRFGRR